MSFVSGKLFSFFIVLQITQMVFCDSELITDAKIYNEVEEGILFTKVIFKQNPFNFATDEKCNSSHLLVNSDGTLNKPVIQQLATYYIDVKMASTNPNFYLDLYNKVHSYLATFSIGYDYYNSIEHSGTQDEMCSIFKEGYALNFNGAIDDHTINFSDQEENDLNEIFDLYSKYLWNLNPESVKFEMNITTEKFCTSYMARSNELELCVFNANNETDCDLCIERDNGEKLCQEKKSLSAVEVDAFLKK